METQQLKISHSSEIKDLVASLAKAQGVMKPAVFNRINPHFKNRYADFTSCMDACRLPLSENGIAPIQYCETVDGKLNLVTMLAHTSGQWMKSEFPLIPSKMDSQGIGSAMTYAKRYSLCGMVGIVADEEGDDDGEAAVGRYSQSQQQINQKLPAQKINPQQIDNLNKLEEKLDKDSREKIYKWLNNNHQIVSLKDITIELYQKVVLTIENAIKIIEQKKMELVHA